MSITKVINIQHRFGYSMFLSFQLNNLKSTIKHDQKTIQKLIGQIALTWKDWSNDQQMEWINEHFPRSSYEVYMESEKYAKIESLKHIKKSEIPYKDISKYICSMWKCQTIEQKIEWEAYCMYFKLEQFKLKESIPSFKEREQILIDNWNTYSYQQKQPWLNKAKPLVIQQKNKDHKFKQEFNKMCTYVAHSEF